MIDCGNDDSELNEKFHQAASLVKTVQVDDAIKLQLYSLYKQATLGDCTISRPPFYQMTERAKFDSWHNCLGLSMEQAKFQYIELANSIAKDGKSGNASGMSSVFSRFKEEVVDDDEVSTPFKVLLEKCKTDDLESFVIAFDKDVVYEEDGTPLLHWAVDSEAAKIVAWLIDVGGADVNQLDSSGATPLHYACTCESKIMAELLLSKGADRNIKDQDGHVPSLDFINSDL